MFEVKTRHVPDQQMLGVRRHVAAPQLPAFIGEAFSNLRAQLGLAGLSFAGAPFVVYYGLVSETEGGPVEVCIPFEGTVTPVGEATVHLVSQREEAYVTLTGAQAHYPEILRAHEAVTAWAREGGKVLIGAAREVYFSEERRPDEPFCDVAYPIA